MKKQNFEITLKTRIEDSIKLKYESKFSRIEYDSRKKMVVHIWSIDTIEMSENEFIDEMKHLSQVFRDEEVERVFVDQTGFYYVISEKLQQWIDENVNKILLDKQAKRIAFVLTPDFLVKKTVTGTLQRRYSQQLEIRFFHDFIEAKTWVEAND